MGKCGGALRHFARFICIWISQLETFSDYFLRLPLRNMPKWSRREEGKRGDMAGGSSDLLP